VLEEQFASANVPKEFWQELQANKKKSLDEVIAFLTFAYRKHFTQQEIAQMYAFYKTEAAQKMMDQSAELSYEENEQLAVFYDSDVGKKVDAKRYELSQDITEISSHWSRELFAEKMKALLSAGYTPKQ
jgi:hypothetical protein